MRSYTKAMFGIVATLFIAGSSDASADRSRTRQVSPAQLQQQLEQAGELDREAPVRDLQGLVGVICGQGLVESPIVQANVCSLTTPPNDEDTAGWNCSYEVIEVGSVKIGQQTCCSTNAYLPCQKTYKAACWGSSCVGTL